MKKIKSIVVVVVLALGLHFAIVFALSDVKIFSCQIKPVVADMEKMEWKDSKCDINYKYWIGSSQRLTSGANVARIGLVYVLPILISTGIIFGLNKRKKIANIA